MKTFKRDISEVRKIRGRDYRKKTGLVIVEGYKEVKKAIQSKVPMKKLYVCPEIFHTENGEFDSLPTVKVDKNTFTDMAFGKRLKGVLAICQPQKLKLSDLKLKKDPIVLILENVEKPGNIGAVLRTCDGAGVDAVLICKGKTDVYNQHVVRSSIGTVFTVTVVSADRDDICNFIKDNDLKVFAASSKADLPYYRADFRSGCAIVVGNEHEGLTPFWKEHTYKLITIPMKGRADSLNVTVSASILVYEAIRQRNNK